MSEDILETQDSQELESDKTLENEVDFGEEELEDLDEDFSTKVKKLNAQRQHWKEKASKKDARIQELEEQLAASKPKKEDKPAKKEKKGETEMDYKRELLKTRLMVKHASLDEEDIDKAMKWAEVEDTTPSEIINSDFFQSYINKKTEKDKQETATPSPSNRSGNPSVKGKSLEDLSPEEVQNMSNKEFDKLVEKQLKKEGLALHR